MNIATVFGIITGVVQVLGFIRWPFMVPYLADTYTNPQSSEATRQAVTVAYHAFNQYAGVAIGEHAGYICVSIWTILISVAMFRSAVFKPWMGWAGIVIGAGILVSSIEEFGFSFAQTFATINVVSYTAWTVWLIVLAIPLLMNRTTNPRSVAATS